MADYVPIMASGDLDGSGVTNTYEEIEKSFRRNGFEGLKKTLKTLKVKPLDIGVVGSTGAGKSSLVNGLTGVDEGDEGGAPVGESETTSERKRYTSRRHPNPYVWDVPGVGTKQHPRATYLDQQSILTFDLVIVVSRSRFTEDDAWLVMKLRENKRRYLFVRTLIDNDIMTSSRRLKIQPGNDLQHEKATMDKVRQDCMNQLKSCQEHVPNDRIFLVCTYEPELYDFPRLLASLTSDSYVSSSKKHSVEKQIMSLYEQMLTEKKEKLKKDIVGDAAPSALMSAIPIPGLGFVGDIANINKVFNKYRTAFEIDEEGLKKHAEVLGTVMPNLGLKTWDADFTAAGIAKLMPYRGVAFLCKFAPGIGSLVGAGVTYSGTFNVLQELLEVVFNDALKVNRYIAEEIIADYNA